MTTRADELKAGDTWDEPGIGPVRATEVKQSPWVKEVTNLKVAILRPGESRQKTRKLSLYNNAERTLLPAETA
jgi:hypothetical protein